jgi:hypothetical protein
VLGLVAGERLVDGPVEAKKAAVVLAKQHGGQAVTVTERCVNPVFFCGWKKKSKRSKASVLRCKRLGRS